MNKKYSEERKYIGSISQLFDVRQYRMVGGKAEGTLAVEVWNGDKLTVTILPDRGMDIYSVRFDGNEMSYQAPAGIVHPSYYNCTGPQWLRTFQGGFLATCGVEWIGGADPEFCPKEGLHGRHNHTPADGVNINYEYDADGEPSVVISGTVRHALMFGVRYTILRTFRFRRGDNTFSFTDEITNEGFTEKPLYLLYHFNLGYPLISESAELLIDAEKVIPANDYSAPFLDKWKEITSPEPDYRQQNYYHYLPVDEEGWRTYGVRNREIGTEMTVRYSSPIMDKIFQWKNLAAGDYVMGLEPTSMLMVGRDGEATGELKHVGAGESVTNKFIFEFKNV